MHRSSREALIKRIAPTAPPCFQSRAQWIEWLWSASDRPEVGLNPLVKIHGDGKPARLAFNYKVSYCTDCGSRFKAGMQAAGMCKPSFVRDQAPARVQAPDKVTP